MIKENEPFLRQIFVCTNTKDDGSVCCGGRNGEEIFRQLRNIAKEKGLHPKIRVAQAKCLGQCAKGANVMIYPEEVWYHGVTLADVPKLADEYIN